MSLSVVAAEAAALLQPWAADPAAGMTPGRLGSVAGALAGLAGAACAVRAVLRPGGPGRSLAVAALVLGPLGTLTGAVVVASADGGLGTGSGLAGGWVSIAVGAAATVLGAAAWARARRAPRPG
ncbi:DUF6223 family protein [Nocardiopsis sp. RSe5-2]|uniref:DUF6223 family protein n=1 Tax=Nocardiopsis endophytica TaxID=3018445 RepID=A0ABT4U080_9ACTN|nr:DUF6223 family protein [Nocardiopsis endophytica]MDA2809772.1 DUF6223 family protein [Nocardiopsis endophytica]